MGFQLGKGEGVEESWCGGEDSAVNLRGERMGVGVIKPQSPAQPVPFAPLSFSPRVG